MRKPPHTLNMNIPNPKDIAERHELPQVEQLGTISLQQLNSYTCDNPDKRVISLFNVLYDVTEAKDKYGEEGSYKDFAGHDITLALGSGKMNPKWLDRFVELTPKWEEGAQGWVDFYSGKYPVCGQLEEQGRAALSAEEVSD